ncbi:hypothetical protein LSH36_573g07025 [Paralvinella palmiformis]|uniref:C-type lectin domain-containing protein n=1 Tax=Paralvinella palmiformis TaxID=53620 RepID=A0AAD9MVK2_9ANNE|nr:hypothetical protein LSH36_573g07025 [Paralvinella palmiformis]
MDYSLLILLAMVSVADSESQFACRDDVIRPTNGLPYYKNQPHKLPYNEAEAECREMDAELLTIRKNEGQLLQDSSRKWLSAKKRSWTHMTLDLGLTYDRELKQQPDTCTAVVMAESEHLEARPCSEIHSIVCMNQDMEKILYSDKICHVIICRVKVDVGMSSP